MNLVVKYGGSVLATDARAPAQGDESNGIAESVVDAVAGHSGNVVLVHGGGPHLSDALARARIATTFIGGLRSTPEEAMQIVLATMRDLNAGIAAQLERRGRRAVATSGVGGLFACSRAWGSGGEDLGRVGRVTQVNGARIHSWWRSRCTPVVAPIGTLEDGKPCNVNADDVAGAIAGALRAPAIFVTDVDGVILDGRVREMLSLDEVAQAQRDGKINGGMTPKTDACVKAVRLGAPFARIVPAGPNILRPNAGTRIAEAQARVP